MTKEEKELMDSIFDDCKSKTSTLRQQYQMAMHEYASQKSTIDKLKLISTLAKFQEQKRITLNVLSNVHQLIVGWRGTLQPNEWTDFDAKTLDELTELMYNINESLPSVGKN